MMEIRKARGEACSTQGILTTCNGRRQRRPTQPTSAGRTARGEKVSSPA